MRNEDRNAALTITLPPALGQGAPNVQARAQARAEFLAELDREAERRRRAAETVPEGKRCSVCKGTGSRTKYVLPGVTGPAECISCSGTGRVPE